MLAGNADHYLPVRLRILVVDDHRMFAEALAAKLTAVDDMTVVGTATDADTAIELARTLRPDVVTLDANLGDTDGVDVARELCALPVPPRIVMVSCVEDLDRVLQAIWAGVTSWVPKETGSATLLEVIRAAARGHAWLPPALLSTVLRSVVTASPGQPPDATRLGALTPRERQVLRCMVAGLDRSATAELLGLSLNTIRTHAQSILTKLHVHSALEAVSVALSAGMRPAVGVRPTVAGAVPRQRFGVVQSTRAPNVTVNGGYARTNSDKAAVTPAAIGVGVLVRWPDPATHTNT